MSQTDGRVCAWMSAWKCLQQAQILKTEPKTEPGQHTVRDPLPELYWSTLAEAQIYADLAKAPDLVGLAAGDWLVEEQEQEQERRRMTAEQLEALQKKLAGQ